MGFRVGTYVGFRDRDVYIKRFLCWYLTPSKMGVSGVGPAPDTTRIDQGSTPEKRLKLQHLIRPIGNDRSNDKNIMTGQIEAVTKMVDQNK